MPWHNRAILRVEQLDERVVPALATTTWTAGGSGNWSNAANWSAGVPDATHVAVLAGGNGVTITVDGNTQAANLTVGGLQSGSFTGTLELATGKTLTVTSDVNDSTTGFQWLSNATIKSDSASDSILLTGGGTFSNNQFGAGTIDPAGTKATLYLRGRLEIC
jgi:hypothetical protein